MLSWLLPSCKYTNQSGKRNIVIYPPYTVYTNNLCTGIKSYIMLHDISDHYPIYLTVGKARLKRDVKQRLFRDTRNVDIIAFDRDLHETL